MNLTPGFQAFLRGLGILVLTTALSFIGNQANIAFLGMQNAVIISSLAVWLEGLVEGKTGKPLFGMVG